MREPEWYVYALVDPRTHEAFYVGKGKDRRAFQHERDAKRGKVRNQQKTDRINEVIRAGFAVEVQILAKFDDEEAAYTYEAQVIKEGENLLNIMPGGGGSRSIPLDLAVARRDLKGSKEALTRIIPFDEWRRRKNPTEAQIEMYHKIVQGFKDVAKHCRRVIASMEAA